ncbi:MAG: DUF1343 domain-containing protein [Gemmatimonadota bacterium]|nr:DUF1343 domain-containing protein [Gemmatimonadota bacterium]
MRFTNHSFGRHTTVAASALLVGMAACAGAPPYPGDEEERPRDERVRPGITVLLEDSSALIDGKRVGLLTNQSGVDERGHSDIDLLFGAAVSRRKWQSGGPRLVALFSPEHGIRGTEDRQFVASGRDAHTGLTVHSLYGATTIAPPDSTLRDLDVLVIDLQDIGTRTWTYQGTMIYAMRAAARRRLPVLVLDRPNPITGVHTEGPLLDTTLAYAGTMADGGRAAKPFALYPIPLRHGLTMGELALFYNQVLSLGAELHVIPARGWRREQWLDQTGLPWIRPSPNMPSLESALLYPGLVAFEGSNLSVGRGTPIAFQHLGAPWLDARRVVALLEDRTLTGVKFEAERFTPDQPTDGKFAGRALNGVRIVVTDRDRVQPARVGAALLWAIAKTHPDSLHLAAGPFDERFGGARMREALLRGDDPDAVIDRELPSTVAFEKASRAFWLYR